MEEIFPAYCLKDNYEQEYFNGSLDEGVCRVVIIKPENLMIHTN